MNRFKQIGEPSTWASLSVLLVIAGVAVPPGSIEAVAQIGAAVSALAGIFMKEKTE